MTPADSRRFAGQIQEDELDMDIFEQVTKLLKDMEIREKRGKIDRQLVEGSILTDLITRYNQYVRVRQWDNAHECLLNISRLVVAMLSE